MVAFTKDEWLRQERKYRGRTKEEILKSTMLSLSYRRTGFRLSLFASDEVIRAYNRLMQCFYRHADSLPDGEVGKTMIGNFGEFLLAIRRSVGNENTILDKIEMLEWMISDVDSLNR